MIYELLLENPDKHMDKPDIMAVTGLSERAIRKQVEYERNELGYPIFSSCSTKGYSVLDSADSCHHFISETLNRIEKLQKSVDMARKTLYRICSESSGQLNLF